MRTRIPAALGAALILVVTAAAQEPRKELTCENGSRRGGQERACEMREMPLPAMAKLSVEASPNGGVNAKAWSRNEILVRARVEAWGATKAEADGRLKEVKIATEGGKVAADGPKDDRRSHYSVSYEVFVPARIDLSLRSVNGGVGVSGVTGAIDANTVNGGIHFSRLAGKVFGKTVNGGVHVELSGSTWQGEGFEAQTVNGGVHIEVPDPYSARLEASTVHGGMHSEIPVKVQGQVAGKRIEATLGSGGPLLKIGTVNGGVHLNRKGA